MILWLFIIYIAINIVVANVLTCIVGSFRDILRALFCGRNIFGKIVSTVTFIFLIPAMFLISIITFVAFVFENVFVRIWEAGNKK